MTTHACNPSTQKAEAEGPEVQGQLALHREIKASLGYTRCVSKKGVGGAEGVRGGGNEIKRHYVHEIFKGYILKHFPKLRLSL